MMFNRFTQRAAKSITACSGRGYSLEARIHWYRAHFIRAYT